MADNQAEQKPAQEKKEEKPKQPTTLESVVNETSEAGTGLINSAIGTAAIGAATYFFGLDGLAISSSFPAGGFLESRLAEKPKPFKSSDFAKEAIAGGLFTPALWYGLKAIKQVPKAFGIDGVVNALGYSIPASALAVGGLTLGVLTPALTALYYPLQYVIKNKTFKGMGKDFKENYWKGFKRTLPLTTLTSAAVGVTYAMPFLAPYLFPALAVANIAYRLLLSKEKLNYAKLLNPFTYVPNFLNPFYIVDSVANLAGKAYRGITSKIYDIGHVIKSLLLPKTLTPTPTTQAATQTA